MMLFQMIIQIRELREGSGALRALVGLLASVNRSHVDIQPALLRKHLVALGARILRKVRILVIDNQTLLLDSDLLVTALHATAPHCIVDAERELHLCNGRWGRR
jgi:hypothetical protein